MADTAAHLVDRVFRMHPRASGSRAFPSRCAIASPYDKELCSAVKLVPWVGWFLAAPAVIVLPLILFARLQEIRVWTASWSRSWPPW